MKILYYDNAGNVCIITPVLGGGLTIDQIALKDVPAGIPYMLIEDTDVPEDRALRSALKIDMSEPDGIGADYGVGSENRVIGWKGHTPIITKD